MQSAETVLGVLRERGRLGLPLEQLYRQMFNPQLYLLAYGRIYANKGAMTVGVSQETVDAMSLGKINRIIEALRFERYRFCPVRRVHIPKKNGKTRPLGLPTWSDKLVGEVVRLLLEAYYEPQFSDRSHGFRPGRGCHTALREVANTWLDHQPAPATLQQLQTLVDRFTTDYNTTRPHRALAGRTPQAAYQARPKATPTGSHHPHHRIRRDTIDTTGVVTLRHAGRLHHIGLGRAHARTPILMLIHDRHIRITHATTGTLIRELTLDPTRDYQPQQPR